MELGEVGIDGGWGMFTVSPEEGHVELCLDLRLALRVRLHSSTGE
jgi:hypothetical protein